MRWSNVSGALLSRSGDRLGDTTTHLITVRVTGPFDARLDDSTKTFANAYDAMDIPRVIPVFVTSTRPTALRVRWFDDEPTGYERRDDDDVDDDDISGAGCVTTTISIANESSIHCSHRDTFLVFLCEESSVLYALDSVQQLRKFVIASIVMVIWLITAIEILFVMLRPSSLVPTRILAFIFARDSDYGNRTSRDQFR